MQKRFTSILSAALLFGLTCATPQASAQSFAGAYLAATQADIRNDYASAGEYYVQALALAPDSIFLMQNALVAKLAAGDTATAVAIARRMQVFEPENQVVGLVLLADALLHEDYSVAGKLVSDEAFGFNPLLGNLVGGWTLAGQDDLSGALARFDAMDQNDALQLYGQYHKSLALALAGDFRTSADILAGDERGPLHVDRTAILAHVSVLSQVGEHAAAVALLEQTLAGGFTDSELEDMRKRMIAGEVVEFSVLKKASDGAAEAFLVLANALYREEAERFALIYARLATHIRPDYSEATALAGDILKAQGQNDLAIATYAEIPPGSPWFVSAEIGRANALRAAGRLEAAVEVLAGLSRERANTTAIHMALGDTLRENEEFAGAAEAYSKAVDLIDEVNENHWVLFYSRGISYERTDEWAKAEADFRRALELRPDQPLVLNYLGYSLVEMGEKLDEAQKMIETAVRERPDDGFITDSLGWVLYRIGKYEEAVPHMERAVELQPVDPIINDHLGDVYWMVGRKREADFQWRRALSFDPEEADAERIRRKLEFGLDAVLEEEIQNPVPATTVRDG